MKVLHGPCNIANQPWGLSREERRLGLKSDVIINYGTSLNYPSDRCLGAYRDRSPYTKMRRLFYGLSSPLMYNVHHYYFGRTLLCWDDYGPRNMFWYLDLKAARLLGRKIFMTLQGCDVRLAGESDITNEVTCCRKGLCSAYETCISQYDRDRRTLINEILPLCHRVFYLNPELGYYVKEGTFLPYSSVRVESIVPVPPRNEGTVIILHAPSDLSIKGTSFVVSAVESLKKKYPIEFRLIQNMKHEEALKAYESADIVIDQLLAGFYGAFAVEVMAMGKPVVCYLREHDFPNMPAAMVKELPFINAGPSSIEEKLSEILENRHRLPEISARSRRFVERWHNPEIIAKAMVAAYRDPESQFTLERYVEGV
ncbi:MAG: glycosyltransferase [Candidatus Xenobiia bacterium LiM19]